MGCASDSHLPLADRSATALRQHLRELPHNASGVLNWLTKLPAKRTAYILGLSRHPRLGPAGGAALHGPEPELALPSAVRWLIVVQGHKCHFSVLGNELQCTQDRLVLRYRVRRNTTSSQLRENLDKEF